jgi:glycerol kinase
LPKKSKKGGQMKYLLAIDQGTTATTVLICNEKGSIVGEDSQEYPQHYPQEGYVEHRADDIKLSVKNACLQAIQKSGINAREIEAVGITNQRETLCLFDRDNRSELPFIVWQCRRSSQICQELTQKGLGQRIHQKTGLHIDPYFTASKLLWLSQQDSRLPNQLRYGKLLFGTIDTFLCHWLSGGKLHITDPTNASRTMLMDLKTCTWDDELLDIFSIPKNCLPTIKNSCEIYGLTKGLDFLPDGIPIASLIGDQQSSLVGHACFGNGHIKATFGTGSFILLNTGDAPIFSSAGLLTSVAYSIKDRVHYCLEGSAFVAGAALIFLRDTFGLISTPVQIDEVAATVSDSQGVSFVPSLCGLGAPFWQADAKGVLCGLTRGTTKGHIARAVLEGIAMQNTDIIQAMAQDHIKPKIMKVDGGAANSDLLMQIQADILNIKCIRAHSTQKTALGAIYLAGLACGVFGSTAEIENLQDVQREFVPGPDRSWVERCVKNYQKARMCA